mmetsp:Transcript_9478/g.15142  ORF Transcript_9478/g.15142 Transcript_9478/m.15142 type:complete len:255 (-) Transcript_9478:1196-1960(-)
MVISISQSLMSSRPFMPMEKLMILMSREVGREARTPVTVRLRALLLMAPDAPPSASALATLTPFMASSRVVMSSSPFTFFPLSFSAFLDARLASFSAFLATFLPSLSAASCATFKMRLDAIASSAAFFAASIRPSSLGSSADSSTVAVPRISDSALGSRCFLSYCASSSNPLSTVFPAAFRVLLEPPVVSSLASSSGSLPFFRLPMGRLMTALGWPSSPISPAPSSSSSSSSDPSSPSAGRLPASSSEEMPTSS